MIFGNGVETFEVKVKPGNQEGEIYPADDSLEKFPADGGGGIDQRGRNEGEGIQDFEQDGGDHKQKGKVKNGEGEEIYPAVSMIQMAGDLHM